MSLDDRPTRDELLAIAERWRPWRGVAAHLLWAYYKVADRSLLVPKTALAARP
jgi:DNA-3-methyladenine glycosylase II